MCQALWWRVQAQWWWEEVSPAIVFNTLEMWLDGWEFPDSGHFVSMQRGTLEVIRRLPEETACTQRPEKENKGEPTRAGVSHTGTYGKVGTSWVFYVRKRWEKASWVLDPECCWAWPEFWEGARERRWRQGQEPGHCKPRWPRCLAVHLDSPKPNPVWNLWHFIKDGLSVLLQLPWGSPSALTHGLPFRDLELGWYSTPPFVHTKQGTGAWERHYTLQKETDWQLCWHFLCSPITSQEYPFVALCKYPALLFWICSPSLDFTMTWSIFI